MSVPILEGRLTLQLYIGHRAPPPTSLQPAARMQDSITFELQLNCHARKSCAVETLQLYNLPSTALEIKQAIQNKFSIPICVQTLSYQDHILSDEECVPDLYRHMRNGDILTVDYSSEADIQKISEIMKWIQSVNTVMLTKKSLTTSAGARVVNLAVQPGRARRYDEILALKIFDWLDDKSLVNKIYFYHCGGLNSLLKLYYTVIEIEWSDMDDTYKYLEIFCTQVLANFAETIEYRRMLHAHAGLKMAVRSLLRMRLEFRDVTLFLESNNSSITTVKRLLEYALHAICK